MKRSRTRATLAALAGLVLTLAAGPAAGSGGLVVRDGKQGGFHVGLPAGWHYKNASYPSDHSTEFWTDPGDPKSKLEVEVSACVGCAQRTSCTLRNVHCGPYPAGLVPRGTISKHSLGKWAESFVARVPGSPYLDRGLVVIQHAGNEIRDWAYVQLYLPESQKQLAGTILASFAFG